MTVSFLANKTDNKCTLSPGPPVAEAGRTRLVVDGAGGGAG